MCFMLVSGRPVPEEGRAVERLRVAAGLGCCKLVLAARSILREILGATEADALQPSTHVRAVPVR